jgi:two-component system, response regulator / RNA-binding antiterminator
MLSVLLIDEDPDRAALLESSLVELGYRVMASVRPGADLYAVCERYRPDIVVVDMDSPDRDTLEHMRSISDRNPRPIVMFTNDDDSSTIQRAVLSGVSAYVVAELNPQRVRPVFDAAIAHFEHYQAIRSELEQAKTSLAERKLIEQAKGILMKKKQMDESRAYRVMQKMAMDRNMRLVDLARSIIAAAELLT